MSRWWLNALDTESLKLEKRQGHGMNQMELSVELSKLIPGLYMGQPMEEALEIILRYVKELKK